jgi:hypothetical protein
VRFAILKAEGCGKNLIEVCAAARCAYASHLSPRTLYPGKSEDARTAVWL